MRFTNIAPDEILNITSTEMKVVNGDPKVMSMRGR